MSNQILPGILPEIAEVAGYETAMQIVRAFGGTHFYFPSLKRLTADHPLSVAVGYDTAKLIIKELFPIGTLIDIPLACKTDISAKVRELNSRGCKVSVMAKSCGVTERTIYRHLSKIRKKKVFSRDYQSLKY